LDAVPPMEIVQVFVVSACVAVAEYPVVFAPVIVMVTVTPAVDL
jgi:hypothetical protein